MPYKKKKDLPEKVKKALPKHAQEIYKETYNASAERYKNPKKRRSKSQSKEQAAHRTAWGAVKKKYAKKGGKWKAKSKK